MIDVGRAVQQRSRVGDPLIAPSFSNYPAGSVVDHFCLVCGRCMAAHDWDDDCEVIIQAASLLDIRKP